MTTAGGDAILDLPDSDEPAPRRTRRGRTRVVLAILVSLALAAGVVGGGWWYFVRSDGPNLTYGGKPIDKPQDLLSAAESNLHKIVEARRGAHGPDTRCYFGVAAGDANATDVAKSVFCGPVLFVDGDRNKPYLTFPLGVASAGDEKVALKVAPAPAPAQPVARPDKLVLTRPDGAVPPGGSGDVTVPAPPAAAKDALVVSDLGGEQVPEVPGAVMAAQLGGVKVTRLGPVERYGAGDAARSAAEGTELIAFGLANAPGQYADSSVLEQTTVRVGKGAPRKLPPTKPGLYYVVAAPRGEAVDLLLTADGITQSISLRNGKPAAGNLAVLRRGKLSQTLSVRQQIVFTFRSGATVTGTTTGTLVATEARLGYWTMDGKAKATKPNTALVTLAVWVEVAGQTTAYNVDTPLLRLTPTGGKPIAAKDVDPGPAVYPVFEVPANFSTGTVAITGSEPASGGQTLTVTRAVTFPVRFPA